MCCYLNNNKVLWSRAWYHQVQLLQVSLVCAGVARMSFLTPKPHLRVLAALHSLQTLPSHPPWCSHEQKEAA